MLCTVTTVKNNSTKFCFSGSVFYDTLIQYGAGTGPIFLSNVKCTGLESRLLECANTVFHTSSCSHYYDIGIKCEGTLLIVY